ncbi:MAG: DNA modification methylase, partial [Gammaproteobacteria bacterium]|nr:DNA modification methylase [Gammaproteobacteria bacterium]
MTKDAVLEIQRVKLADVKIHPRNPRIHPKPGSAEWESLKASLIHDYFDPLVLNTRNNMWVSGHLRSKVLLAEGYVHADVVVKDYDEETHYARMIAANKQIGEFDFPALKDLMEEIDTGAFDM